MDTTAQAALNTAFAPDNDLERLYAEANAMAAMLRDLRLELDRQRQQPAAQPQPAPRPSPGAYFLWLASLPNRELVDLLFQFRGRRSAAVLRTRISQRLEQQDGRRNRGGRGRDLVPVEIVDLS